MKKSGNKSSDNFIQELNKSNENKITDISSFDSRRLVFVSLIGLFKSYKKCPTVSLYSSIFILPLQKKWIYDYDTYKNELNSKLNCIDEGDMDEFIQLLQWKDSQNLCFFMLDIDDFADYNTNNENELIAPFWNFLSEKLSNLYDPVTRGHYNALKFKESWWRNDCTSKRYHVKNSSIFSELYFVCMKYKCIQEIIYQSNPESLNPVISYNVNTLNNYYVKTKFDLEVSVPSHNGDWFVTADYDMYTPSIYECEDGGDIEPQIEF